jgi:adenosylmethionine-8-amino-7-oxononanoate aminotransferase
LFDVVRVPIPGLYRLPNGVSSDRACDYFLEQVERALAANQHQIAGVIIEPLVQCAAGIVTHPVGFLSGLRELTRRFDVLMIADEVATGFGRTGSMFACEQENVSPDLLCLGKGLTAGYLPMAATLATGQIWHAFLGRFDESKTFFHGHTYGGNPLAAATALASLDIFDEEKTLANVANRSQQLTDHLDRIKNHPHVGDVRQRGLIAGIELVHDKGTDEPYPWTERRGQRVCDFARTKGVWLRPLGNVVVIMPPLAIAKDELDIICSAVVEGIDSATAGL